MPFFEDPPDHADVGAWDDEDAGQPPGSSQELSDDGRRLLELYRLLLADSEVGDGGRLVCRASEERLAGKLDVSVPTIKRRIADLGEPGADPRHPKARQAGRRLGWLKVVPKRATSEEHKGQFIGNRYVLLLDWDQATSAAAQIQGSRPKAQVGAKDHDWGDANVLVGAKDHEAEPRITSGETEPRITPEEALSPAQSQGSRPPVILPNSLKPRDKGGERGFSGAFSNPGGSEAQLRPSRLGSMAEEAAWVRSQRRHGEWPEPEPGLSEGQQANRARDEDVRAAILATRSPEPSEEEPAEEPVAVAWQGDVGYVLEAEQAGAVLALEELLDGAELLGLVGNDEEEPAAEAPGDPLRYGRWRLDGSVAQLRRAVDQLAADTVSEGYARMVLARRRSA